MSNKQQYPPAPSVDKRLIGIDDPMNIWWWLGISLFALVGLATIVLLIFGIVISIK